MHTVLAALPHGCDTMLSRMFAGAAVGGGLRCNRTQQEPGAGAGVDGEGTRSGQSGISRARRAPRLRPVGSDKWNRNTPLQMRTSSSLGGRISETSAGSVRAVASRDPAECRRRRESWTTVNDSTESTGSR